MTLAIIVAMSRNRVIGINNKLPWYLPEDLKRFRKITSGHPVIMGRRTFESIGRLLPGRENIIITRNQDYKVLGATIRYSLEEALAPFKSSDEEVFILGGGEIFKLAMPLVNRIYLTLIDQDFKGDAYFPETDFSKYKIIAQEKHTEPMPYQFIDLEVNL
jgi:dihydrofolate reductase